MSQEIHYTALRQAIENHPNKEALDLLLEAEATIVGEASEGERVDVWKRIRDFIETQIGAVHWDTPDCHEGDCETCDAHEF